MHNICNGWIQNMSTCSFKILFEDLNEYMVNFLRNEYVLHIIGIAKYFDIAMNICIIWKFEYYSTWKYSKLCKKVVWKEQIIMHHKYKYTNV